jgi:hypothetical protein
MFSEENIPNTFIEAVSTQLTATTAFAISREKLVFAI